MTNTLYQCPKCKEWKTRSWGPRFEHEGNIMCEDCLICELMQYYEVLDEIPHTIPIREVSDDVYSMGVDGE